MKEKKGRGRPPHEATETVQDYYWDNIRTLKDLNDKEAAAIVFEAMKVELPKKKLKVPSESKIKNIVEECRGKTDKSKEKKEIEPIRMRMERDFLSGFMKSLEESLPQRYGDELQEKLEDESTELLDFMTQKCLMVKLNSAAVDPVLKPLYDTYQVDLQICADSLGVTKDKVEESLVRRCYFSMDMWFGDNGMRMELIPRKQMDGSWMLTMDSSKLVAPTSPNP